MSSVHLEQFSLREIYAQSISAPVRLALSDANREWVAELLRHSLRAAPQWLAPTRLLWLNSANRTIRAMPMVSLQAHFDGKQIVLDEPFDLPPNASLVVTLLRSGSNEMPEALWLKAASDSEAFKFLADPAEDIYTSADGEPLDRDPR